MLFPELKKISLLIRMLSMGTFDVVGVIGSIKKLIVCTLLSMFTTAITTFIIAREIEVIAGASLFGLFILPSIFIYYVLDCFQRSQKVKTTGYIIPIVGWLIFLIVCIILDAKKESSEGAGQLATAILISDLIAGAVVYIFMLKVKWLK